MTPVQQAAIDKANAQIAPAMELYAHRTRISYLVGMLPLQDLRELRRLLDRLTPDELRELAAYAQGLAAWREPAQESQDAPIPPRAASAGGADRP